MMPIGDQFCFTISRMIRMASLTRVIGISRSAPDSLCLADLDRQVARTNVIADAVDDLDRDLQLFPEDVDALENALAEGVVDMQNNRGLRLNAGRRAELLDACDGIGNKRGRRAGSCGKSG